MTEALAEPFPWDGPVLELLRRAGRGRHPFLLWSGTAGEGRGRFSLVGSDPFRTWRAGESDDPFTRVAELASSYPVTAPPGLPFAGGLVGYLGHECLRHVERVAVRPADAWDPPDAWFGLYASAVVVDHAEDRVWLVATGLPEPRPERRRRHAEAQLERLRRRLSEPARPATPWVPGPGPLRSSLPRPAYVGAVRRILEHIRRGEIYQANLTQRLEAAGAAGDPVELLARLHEASPAPHAAFLDLGDWQILSSSPERFLRRAGDRVESRPIKGTAPRGASPAEDAARREALGASLKDRAENLMIVDLVRNDLGRVCRPGSVTVPALCALETFATVHHLVSTVEGRLHRDAGVADLLRAVFPPGSMTGAPKVRALEVLHELEPVRRGPYAGVLGYLSFCGRLDLSVVIRTVMLGHGRARFHVGGGIVADSDPEGEYEESLWKARALLTALGLEAPGAP